MEPQILNEAENPALQQGAVSGCPVNPVCQAQLKKAFDDFVRHKDFPDGEFTPADHISVLFENSISFRFYRGHYWIHIASYTGLGAFYQFSRKKFPDDEWNFERENLCDTKDVNELLQCLKKNYRKWMAVAR